MAHTSEYEIEDIFIDRLEGSMRRNWKKKDIRHHFQIVNSIVL